MQGGKGVGTEGISMTTRSPSHFHIHRLVLLMNRVKRSRTVSQSQRDSVLSNRADSCWPWQLQEEEVEGCHLWEERKQAEPAVKVMSNCPKGRGFGEQLFFPFLYPVLRCHFLLIFGLSLVVKENFVSTAVEFLHQRRPQTLSRYMKHLLSTSKATNDSVIGTREYYPQRLNSGPLILTYFRWSPGSYRGPLSIPFLPA